MRKYRDILQAVDSDLNEWIPQSILEDAIRAVETDTDLKGYIDEKSLHSDDVAPYSALDLYTSLIAILVTAKAVWNTIVFADKVANMALDHNAKLVLAEKIVLRLKQAGMDYSADKVQSWIDDILEVLTKPE